MRLEGKTALSTGPAQDLGQQMGYALAAEDCNIASFDVPTEQLEAGMAEIRSMGRRAFGPEVDVRDYEAVQTAVARVYEEFGGLDILANNAGKARPCGTRPPDAQHPDERDR
jgi:NAD(P)-dependent dehydrogenase (short-subunit alcohol dehydrogenase family)